MPTSPGAATDPGPDGGLSALRTRVLGASLAFVSVAATLGSVFVLLQGVREGSNNAVSWGLSGGTLAFPLLWLLRRRLGFRAAAWLFVGLVLLTAFAVRLRGGMGTGPTLLNVLSVVLAGLFFGGRGAVASLAATLLLLGLAGALILVGVVPHPSPSLWDATRPIVWLRTVVLVGLFCGAIAAAVVYVVQRLEADARELREAMAREREQRGIREATQRALEHSQRLEALGRMAGGIAHDFNNALTVVLGAAASAGEEGRSPAEVRAALADIAGAAGAASHGGTEVRLLLPEARAALTPAAPAGSGAGTP